MALTFSKLFLLALELFSFVTALWTFKYHNAVFRLFFFDLLFISILESAGTYTGALHPNAKFLYAVPNLFIVVEIPIIYFLTLKLIPNYLFQKMISVGVAGFLVLWIKHAVQTKLGGFPTFPILYGSIFALITFLAILIRMIGKDNIFKQPLFYFCLGMLIFYGCIIPYIGVVNYFVKKDNGILQKLVQILFVSNYIRYSLFTVSYILLARQQKAKLAQNGAATN